MRSALLLCLVFGIMGCGCVAPRPAPTVPPVEVPGPESLLEVDRAFARLAVEKGVAEAFYTYASEDAMLFPVGELPVKGRDAIRIQMATAMGGQLRWEPREAEISSDGRLGYTWGYFEHQKPGADGQSVLRHGKYVTVWKRAVDGLWKFALDISNPGPPPR
jgi:ketosteroid isomerase-like protein